MAHAKSGDAAQIAGYVGKKDELDKALVDFVAAYAGQTERDYRAGWPPGVEESKWCNTQS